MPSRAIQPGKERHARQALYLRHMETPAMFLPLLSLDSRNSIPPSMKKLLSATINEQVAELLEKVKSTADFGYVQFDSINATNALGDNALHCVCVWGDLAAAKLLVEHGINVNQRGEFGFTPLKIAIDFGHCEIAEYLQANGANPSSVDAPETFDPERNALHMQRLGEQIEFLVQQFAKGCTIETQPIEPSSGASGASRFT